VTSPGIQDHSGGAANWSEVVAAALVGTDRRPAAGGAFGLLDTAAALGLRRRAGVDAAHGIALPEPAPRDVARPASPAAAARLAGLLDPFTSIDGRGAETRLELVDEWISAGRLAPGDLLPALLDLGRRHRRLRPALLAVGGERGRWLAAQRADWRYLLGEADEGELTEPWDLAPIGRRIGHLTAVRRRDPAAGRALLVSTWDSEGGDDRAALLGTLDIGLSTADEELLERALDDPRREVRGTALDLLARLPTSRYGARMAARARSCLRVGPHRIEVRPPARCDSAMQRDGVTPRAPTGVGQRSWWLEEVLARTPMATWGTPDDLLRLPIPEEWAGDVRRGLGRAAAAQGNGEWAAELVDRLWPEATAAQRPDDRLLLEALYEALPAGQRAERAAEVLRADPGRATAAGVERLLELCPRPWPPGLAEAALAAIAVLVRGGASTWRLAGLVTLAGTRLPLSSAAGSAIGQVELLRAAFAADRPADPRLATIDQLLDVLRFRHEMHEELAL
jgi:hypothetical protein